MWDLEQFVTAAGRVGDILLMLIQLSDKRKTFGVTKVSVKNDLPISPPRLPGEGWSRGSTQGSDFGPYPKAVNRRRFIDA